jgi:hypothetical protein
LEEVQARAEVLGECGIAVEEGAEAIAFAVEVERVFAEESRGEHVVHARIET